MKFFVKLSLLLLLFRASSAFPELPEVELDQPRMRSESEQDLTVAGCVNVISGTFFHTTPDVQVGGAEPLEWSRTYESSNLNTGDSRVGFGGGIHSPTLLYYKGKSISDHKPTFIVESRMGSTMEYHLDEGSGKTLQGGVIKEDLYQSGYCNLSSASFGRHIKNARLSLSGYGKEYEWGSIEVSFGDGHTQYYQPVSRYMHAMKREVKPNGNQVFYDYDSRNRPTRIRSTDSLGKKTLAEINVTYEGDSITIEGSNGQKAHYYGTSRNIIHRIDGSKCGRTKNVLHLDRIESDISPSLSYTLKNQRIFNRYTQGSETRYREGRRVEVPVTYAVHLDYFLPSQIYQGGSFLEIEYEEGTPRVSELRGPVGKNGETRLTHRFTYNDELKTTDHFDAYGYQTRYWKTDRNLIKGVEEFEGKGPGRQHYRAIGFKWDNEGKLITRTSVDAGGVIRNCQAFSYDQWGNIRKARLVGNLSGSNPNKIQLDASGYPSLEKQEHHATTYSYSAEGKLLWEIEDHGLKTAYTYKPGTNLVQSKLTYDGNEIIQREFFGYNDDATVRVHFRDDGSATQPTDHTGVTERLLERTEYNTQGLPLVIRSLYLDQGVEKLLKREELTYTLGDLVASRSIFDADGTHQYTLTYKYDQKRRLVQESDPIGRITSYQYDEGDRITLQARSGSGFYTLFTYDLAGRLIQSEEVHENGDHFIRTKSYDLKGRVTEESDHFGQVTRYQYDNFDRVVVIDYPASEVAPGLFERRKEYRSYDIDDNLVSVTDRNGNLTTHTYNSRNQVTSTTFPDGTKESHLYNSNGTLQQTIDRTGIKSWFGYDKLKRLVCTEVFDATDAHLYSLHNSYNAFHLLSSSDPMGVVTEVEYDAAGRKITEIKEGRRTTYTYDALGREQSVTQGTLTTIREYDNADRVIESRVETSEGKLHSRETLVYDGNDNITKRLNWIDQEEASVTETHYNSSGKLCLTIDPEGRKSRTVYSYYFKDAGGYRVARSDTTDPEGNLLVEIRNTFGEVAILERFRPTGELTESVKFVYDAVCEKIHEKRLVLYGGTCIGTHIIEWERDEMGRPTTIIEQPWQEEAKETFYRYDHYGRLAETIKPNGLSIYQRYDALGRMSRLFSSDGTVDYRYFYDLNGNLLRSADSTELTGSTEREVDEWGKLRSEALANGLQSRYRRNSNDQLTQIQLPDLSTIDYLYEGPNLVAIERRDSSGNLAYAHHNLSHDLRGGIRSERLAADAGERTTQYDLTGRPIEIEAPHYRFTLDDFDQAGHVTQQSVNHESSRFTYDNRYQIIQEQGASNHHYSYDSLENRRSKDGKEYILDGVNQLLSDGEESFHYDPNGNLISVGDTEYRYDALDRLIEVSEQGTILARYRYDSFGRRVSKTASGRTEYYLYYGEREIGSFVEGKMVELRVPSTAHPVTFELNDKLFIPLYDHRGSVLSLLDESGSLVANYRYTAFGEEVESEPLSPWRFEGQRLDPETGFLCFAKRYYLPKTGRWLTPDPLGFVDGPNRYAYVHNNPLMYLDPTGLFSVLIGINIQHDTGDSNPFPFPIPEGRVLRQFRQVGGEYHPSGKVRVNFHNGILNDWKSSSKVCKFISETHGGIRVLNNCDPTRGFLSDLVQATFLLLGGKTRAVRNLVADWREQLKEMGPDGVIYQYAHSRGVLVVRQAIKKMTKDELARIVFVGLAPPKEVRSKHLKRIRQVSNRSDPVTMIGRAYNNAGLANHTHSYVTRESSNHEIVSGGKGDFGAHGVLECSVYREAIEKSGREFVEEYGVVR